MPAGLNAGEMAMHNGNLERWAVIGGGLLGMAVARRLALAGREVHLFAAEHHEVETSATTRHQADHRPDAEGCDRHCCLFSPFDDRLLELIHELGLADAIRWIEFSSNLYLGGRFHRRVNPGGMRDCQAVSVWRRLRLAWTAYYASRIRNWKRLERIAADAWLKRWSGSGAFEAVWRPWLRARLGDEYSRASAAAVWAEIVRERQGLQPDAEHARRGVLCGGFGRLIERLRESLPALGGVIALGQAARRVEPERGELWVALADGRREAFERIVLTLPAPAAARLCPDLRAAEVKSLRTAPHQGLLSVAVRLRRPLAEPGIVSISDDSVPFTAAVHLPVFDRQGNKEEHAVYLTRLLKPDSPMFDWPGELLQRNFLSALVRLYPEFRSGEAVDCRITRSRYALPITALHHSENVPPMESSIPGVALVNASQIVNRAVSVEALLRLADDAAQRLLALPGPLSLAAASPELEAECSENY